MPIQDDLQAFLAEWHDPSPFLEVQTSGSTGTPKRMRVRKDRMLNSARLTCDYLGLKKGDKALLCMPLRYIAGKMMVVRSLYAGLDLEVREPSGHPLADWGDTPLRFAAMIPLQVYNTLRVPEERKRLEQTDILIIGGGAIDAALEQEIRQMPNTVYSTYGMTETLSHVALRRLNGPEASPYYHPFSSVTLSLSPDNTLVIDAPLVCDERLVTNDVARLLPDGSFAIIGRKDNIINSGGIKIQIEEVEAGFEIVRRQLESPDNVLIIVGSLFDANQVLEHFRELKTLNLGGLRMRPNGKVLNERTALTSEDIAICRRLLERKIMITVRHSPEVAESLLTESVLKQL